MHQLQASQPESAEAREPKPKSTTKITKNMKAKVNNLPGSFFVNFVLFVVRQDFFLNSRKKSNNIKLRMKSTVGYCKKHLGCYICYRIWQHPQLWCPFQDKKRGGPCQHVN